MFNLYLELVNAWCLFHDETVR